MVRRCVGRLPRSVEEEEAMAGRRRKQWTSQRNSKSGLQFLTRDNLYDRHTVGYFVVAGGDSILLL